MPFQSEKQRRYLHANHPDIANRWEAKYGLGGIAELNSQLNQLPEYYLPKNQGGRIGFNQGGELNAKQLWEKMMLEDYTPTEEEKKLIQWYLSTFMNQGGMVPSHKAGIYGLAEGGKIIDGQSHQLSYITPGEAQTLQHLGGKKVMTPEGIPAYPPQGQSAQHGGKETSSTGSTGNQNTGNQNTGGNQGSDHGHSRFDVGSGYYGEPKTTPTPKDDPDGRTQALINISKQKKRPTYIGDEDLEGQLERDQQIALNRLKYDRNLTKREREGLEVGLGLRALKPKRSIWKNIGMGAAIITGVAPLLGIQAPAAVQTIAQLNTLHNNAEKALATYNMINKTDHTLESLFSQVKNMESADQKIMESLPKGHPERIALEAKMKIKTPPKGPDGEGGDKVNITMDVEAVNDANADKVVLEQKYKEMDEASYEAWLRQQELEAKKQAYYNMFRQRYMSAQGGRVPAGYNTGGLSNLFRLKNI
jgi:hypothetical protein